MTNGEKLCYIFPEMHYTLSEKQPRRVVTTIGVCASFDLDWWNAEYKEPVIHDNEVENELNQDKNELEITTKNDLGVDCVSRNDVERIIERDYGSCWNENDYYDRLLADLEELTSVTPQEPRCKECKWWKDSDGKYRRGCGAESKCPINRREVFKGNGYCYLYEPQESEDKE